MVKTRNISWSHEKAHHAVYTEKWKYKKIQFQNTKRQKMRRKQCGIYQMTMKTAGKILNRSIKKFDEIGTVLVGYSLLFIQKDDVSYFC